MRRLVRAKMYAVLWTLVKKLFATVSNCEILYIIYRKRAFLFLFIFFFSLYFSDVDLRFRAGNYFLLGIFSDYSFIGLCFSKNIFFYILIDEDKNEYEDDEMNGAPLFVEDEHAANQFDFYGFSTSITCSRY